MENEIITIGHIILKGVFRFIVLLMLLDGLFMLDALVQMSEYPSYANKHGNMSALLIVGFITIIGIALFEYLKYDEEKTNEL